jgi:hypothetical protein
MMADRNVRSVGCAWSLPCESRIETDKQHDRQGYDRQGCDRQGCDREISLNDYSHFMCIEL